MYTLHITIFVVHGIFINMYTLHVHKKNLTLHRVLIGQKLHRAPLKGPGEKAFTLEGTQDKELSLQTFLTDQLSSLSEVRVTAQYVATQSPHSLHANAKTAVWLVLQTLNIMVLPYTQFAMSPCMHEGYGYPKL